jgi:hypothetical protein
MKGERLPWRELMVIVAGQATTAATAFGAVRLMLALTLSSLLFQVAFAPIASGVSRLLNVAVDEGRLGELRTVIIGDLRRMSISGLLAASILTVVLCARQGASGWSLPLLAAVSGCVSGGSSIVEAALIASRRQTAAALWQAAHPLARYGTGLLFASASGTSAAVLCGYVVGTLLLLSIGRLMIPPPAGALFARGPLIPVPSGYRDECRRYMAPFRVWNAAGWAHGSSDRWALGLAVGPAATGAYALHHQLGYYPVVLLTAVLEQGLIPRLFRSRPFSRRWVFLLAALPALFAGCGALGWFAAADAAAHILLDPRYSLDPRMLALMSLGAGCFGSGQVLSLLVLRERGSVALRAAKVWTSVAGCVANIAGAWSFGPVGAAGAIFGHGFCYLLWTGGITARVSERPPADPVHDDGRELPQWAHGRPYEFTVTGCVAETGGDGPSGSCQTVIGSYGVPDQRTVQVVEMCVGSRS